MTATANEVLERLEIEPVNSGACDGDWISQPSGGELASINPADGSVIARVRMAGRDDYEQVAAHAAQAFREWRMIPAPKRGEIVREMADELRRSKADLGALVTMEMGKIRAEGQGEVQEMIDVADFAVGLSRQLYGLTMHSERPGHRMYEQWHPLGVAGVISAFNFPVAVWSWNAMIAAVCGDCVLWKPSSDTPLTAIAVQKISNRVLDRHGLKGIFNLVIGRGDPIGEAMLNDARVPLVSFTGSTQVGRRVAQTVSHRMGRTILELGGNNGIVVMDDANFDLALRAVLFGAVGTAGQRCTTTRRLFLQKGIAGRMTDALVGAYKQVTIGDPLDPHTLMGPLVNQRAVEDMMEGLDAVRGQGGEVIYGGRLLRRADPGEGQARYAHPARGDLRPDFVSGGIRRPRPGHPVAQRCAAGPVFGYVHGQPDFRRALPEPRRQRLRHRQHQHWHQRRGDRRRIRRRERYRRRARIRQRFVEGLHAPPDQHHQLVVATAPGPRHRIQAGGRALARAGLQPRFVQ